MTEDDFHMIEAAIQGELGQSELAVVKTRLETDMEFRKNYEDTRLMINTSKSVALGEMLKGINEESKTGRTISFPRQVMAMAAVLLVVVLAGLWLYRAKDKDLFNTYYEPFEKLHFNAPRGTDQIYDIKLSALQKYSDHQPLAAIQVLDSVFIADPTDEEALFLAGLCYLDMKEFNKALGYFKLIQNQNDDAILWYTALGYVGAGDNRMAREFLLRIKGQRSKAYFEKAQSLFGKIPQQ